MLKDARELLMQDDYIKKNDGVTPNKIAYALLRYTTNASSMSTTTTNFLQAIAFTIEELDHAGRTDYSADLTTGNFAQRYEGSGGTYEGSGRHSRRDGRRVSERC
jgi:hypothetical protein